METLTFKKRGLGFKSEFLISDIHVVGTLHFIFDLDENIA